MTDREIAITFEPHTGDRADDFRAEMEQWQADLKARGWRQEQCGIWSIRLKSLSAQVPRR